MNDAGSPGAGRRPRFVRLRRAVRATSWLALAAVLGVAVALRFGDAWWPATVAMFGPRWVWAVPPAGLVLLTIPWKGAGRVPAALALGVALGPVMGLCVPWRQLAADPPGDGPRVRVLTCNMHYGKVAAGPLDALIRAADPDVVALQEWRDPASSAELAGPGWHVRRDPGLVLASRYPIRDATRIGSDSTGPTGTAARYTVVTPAGVITVFSVHLASPRHGLGGVAAGGRGADVEANSARRAEQSAAIAGSAAEAGGPVLLVGDFNTPPESVLFRRSWAGYEDAFGAAGWGWGYTFVNRRTRTRIDHILVGGGGRARRCWVGPDVGSPHRPVLADVEWPAGP